ncbi:MAG: YbjN domain-containing protein [Paracoccaceae bacterium]
MTRTTSIVFLDETHPIDALELIAHEENWEFVRDEDNQLTVTIDGGWKKYTVTAIWNVSRNLFKTSCAFEMMPPRKKLVKLYETINLVNVSDIDGSFTYDIAEQLMNYNTNILFSDELIISNTELRDWVKASTETAEKFYPTFQKSCWGEVMPKDAMSVAFGKIAGHA